MAAKKGRRVTVKKTPAAAKKNGKAKGQLAVPAGTNLHLDDGDEGVVKLSELDALRFGKLDSDIRNHLQGVQLADMKILSVQREAREQVTSLEVQRERLRAMAKSLQPQYDALVKELADKHGIPDPKRMIIDPEAGTVRDTQTDL